MDYIYNNKTKRYEIAKANTVEKEVKNFIENNAKDLLPVIDDATWSATRKARVVINNKLKEVQKFRKQTNGIVLGEFNRMSNAIENMLSEESDRLTALLEAYKPKEPVYVFKEIKTTDKVAYDKLVAYAKKLNLIKEEKE